jgi:hypothetical protein
MEDRDSFRFIVDDSGDPDAKYSIRTIEVPPPVSVLSSVSALSSVSILLPPTPTMELRRRVRLLLRAVDSAWSSATVHAIVTKVEWSDVGSVSDLRQRLVEAEEASGNNPVPGFFERVSASLFVLTASSGAPFLIVPKTSEAGVFLIAGSAEHSRPLLFYEMPPSFGRVRDATIAEVLSISRALSDAVKGKLGLPTFTILIPSEASADVRSSVTSLVAELIRSGCPETSMFVRSTSLPMTAFSDADTLEGHMNDIGEQLWQVWTDVMSRERR